MCFLLLLVVLIKRMPSVGKCLRGAEHFYVETAGERIMGFMSSCNQQPCGHPFLHCSPDLWTSQPTACEYFS